MDFDHDKKMHLEKKDKSSKGSIDSQIAKLCSTINSLDNYYTTSSCSGRIAVFRIPESGRKDETEWLFVSHDLADADKINEAVSNLPEEEVWFRFEPLILHVASRSLEDAQRLLGIVQGLGIKRSGIIALGNKIVLEIIGTGRIDTIIGRQGQLLISEEYLQVLIEEADRKMERNWENIARLEKEIGKL